MWEQLEAVERMGTEKWELRIATALLHIPLLCAWPAPNDPLAKRALSSLLHKLKPPPPLTEAKLASLGQLLENMGESEVLPLVGGSSSSPRDRALETLRKALTLVALDPASGQEGGEGLLAALTLLHTQPRLAGLTDPFWFTDPAWQTIASRCKDRQVSCPSHLKADLFVPHPVLHLALFGTKYRGRWGLQALLEKHQGELKQG